MIQARPLDLNILPEQYRPRRITAPMVIAIVVTAALLLGLIPAYVSLTAGQARLKRTRAALAQAQVDGGQLEQVNQQLQQTREQIAQLQAELGTVSQRHTLRSSGITAATIILVPQLHIITLTQDGYTFTVNGEAGSKALVLDYARALQSGGQFANVFIFSMTGSDPLAQSVRFSIKLEQ
ncbi:MAG: PilN domain-containing protein [Chloroflexota bacterium]|nr:PilN domain-containing protein [Chloroflexota bacterium]